MIDFCFLGISSRGPPLAEQLPEVNGNANRQLSPGITDLLVLTFMSSMSSKVSKSCRQLTKSRIIFYFHPQLTRLQVNKMEILCRKYSSPLYKQGDS